jgi:hypothetical protein
MPEDFTHPPGHVCDAAVLLLSFHEASKAPFPALNTRWPVAAIARLTTLVSAQ